MTFVYPRPDFDQPNKVLGLLGALWSRNYSRADCCRTLTEANLDLLKQAKTDLDETVACFSKETVPEYHTEHCVRISFKESELNGLRVLAPCGLVQLPLITNRLTKQSLLWHEGVDYRINDKYLEFRENPFDNPLFAVADDSTDREIVLWGINGKYSSDYLYSNYGYALNLHCGCSRRLVSAIMTALVRGGLTSLERVIAAMLDVPVTTRPIETVLNVARDRRGPFVATDAQIYRLPEKVTASVVEGQKLKAETPLIKAFEMRKLGPGAKIYDLLDITVPVALMSPEIKESLSFQNVEATVADNRFPIDGDEEAVDKFWELVNKQAQARGVNFVLPNIVNPLRYLVDNILCNNTVLLIADWEKLDLQLLKSLTPPHMALLFAQPVQE